MKQNQKSGPRKSSASASSAKLKSAAPATAPVAGETGGEKLSKRKQAIMRAHAIRRLKEQELFDCLCNQERPQPIATLRGRPGRERNHTILRAVDSYGAYHLFIHKPENEPGSQVSTITDRDAIMFIALDAIPECLWNQALSMLTYGKLADEREERLVAEAKARAGKLARTAKGGAQ